MKIDTSIKGLAQRGGITPSRPSDTAAARIAEEPGLQVELSATARMQTGATGGAFNAERVAEIRQAISEGRFQVNPERIADGLLDSVRDMLSRRGPA
jgi:negative regulator of flagellin synthesis FlgM